MGKKMSDYMAGRDDGLLLALKIVKEDGVEALEKEIHFRNLTGIQRGAGRRKNWKRSATDVSCQSCLTCC